MYFKAVAAVAETNKIGGFAAVDLIRKEKTLSVIEIQLDEGRF